MKAHIKWHATWPTGIIRGWIDETKSYEARDKYDFVAFAIRTDNHVDIEGAHGVYDRSLLKAITLLMLKAGVETVHWERMNNKPRKITKKLK